VHLGYRLIHALSPRIPLRASLRLAEWAADVQWRRSPQVCGVVEATRARLLAAGPEGTARISREVFRNFARYLVEFFAIHRPERPTLVVEGAGHLERCAASGQGAILLTGHLGNWEVGAMLIRQMGFPVSVVALPHPDPRTDRLFTRQRQRCGVGVIPLGAGAARQSLRRLTQGDLLGVSGDWDVAGDGVAVPFGAGSLAMPRGPAVLSLRSGAPVIPTFLIREGVWAFRLFIEPPIWPEHDGAPEGAAQPLTRRYAAVLERYVKRFPEQWLLLHEAIVPPPVCPPEADRKQVVG
jgi:KDO2-lipid IV(A) lauroyltransferase